LIRSPLAALTGLALLLVTSAHAAEVNLWFAPGAAVSHFPTPVTTGAIVNPSGSNNGVWRSSLITLGPSSFNVEARGYTTANGDGTGSFTQRDVRTFGGINGLGVCDDRSSGSVDACTSPDHSVDNQGVDNLIIFDFGKDANGNNNQFAPVSFSIGWTNESSCSSAGTTGNGSCPDIEAWVGDTWPLSDWASVSASSAWKKILFAGPTNADNNIQVNTESQQHYYPFQPGKGRYLIIAGERDGSNNDYFKLQSLVIEQLPPAEVPVPGSLGLLALGSVLGLLFVRRLPLA
jgi:hypothetical protein